MMSKRRNRLVLVAAIIGVGLRPDVAAADDKLLLSADGTKVAGAAGGGGEVDWLHNSDAFYQLTTGLTYQSIADARWAYATLGASATPQSASTAHTTVWGELHEGSGRIGRHDFAYSVVAAAASRRFTPKLTIEIEDRQIEVDTTHGNLPKVGLTLQSAQHSLASVAYAYSIGGNLRTQLATARVDRDFPTIGVHAGASVGRIAPAAVALQAFAAAPAQSIHEQFLGLSRQIHAAQWLLVFDHQSLGNTDRLTITLMYTMRIGRPST